jgi:cell division septum initiation protein DivIVA
VTTGRETYVIDDARDSLRLLLRRGRTYRVWFQAEAMGEQFVVGQSKAITEATRRRMVVRVDEDEVDLLATHDSDMKEQLATHDEDVKEQLDRIEAKIDDINEKLSLVLKTQLEQTLVAPKESRLTVLYTDRLDEVCDTAQEALDDSEGLGYRVKQHAQRLVDRARAMAGHDPKQAVALCKNAYQSAAFPQGR